MMKKICAFILVFMAAALCISCGNPAQKWGSVDLAAFGLQDVERPSSGELIKDDYNKQYKTFFIALYPVNAPDVTAFVKSLYDTAKSVSSDGIIKDYMGRELTGYESTAMTEPNIYQFYYSYDGTDYVVDICYFENRMTYFDYEEKTLIFSVQDIKTMA